ncbi:MAG: hypothetical protein ACLFPL_05670 [Candidatus Nanoarchaeia archaeon]
MEQYSLSQVDSLGKVLRAYNQIPFDEQGLKFYVHLGFDENEPTPPNTHAYLIKNGSSVKGMVAIQEFVTHSTILVEAFQGIENERRLEQICREAFIDIGTIEHPNNLPPQFWGEYITREEKTVNGKPADASVFESGLEQATILARHNTLVYPVTIGPDILNIPVIKELGFSGPYLTASSETLNYMREKIKLN